MEIVDSPLPGCFLIKNSLFRDERGYFFESFNQQKFSALTGWEGHFVQDNQSESSYGVVRGLHFQRGDNAQAKLVRVIKGTVLDVVLDIRPTSDTFGKAWSVELSDDNQHQLFIPRGFAHGFSVLSSWATFFYKCDNYYHKASEDGLYPLDPAFGIDWKIPADRVILSPKDAAARHWKDYLEKEGLSKLQNK